MKRQRLLTRGCCANDSAIPPLPPPRFPRGITPFLRAMLSRLLPPPAPAAGALVLRKDGLDEPPRQFLLFPWENYR